MGDFTDKKKSRETRSMFKRKNNRLVIQLPNKNIKARL